VTWHIALIIFITMLLQASICVGCFLLGINVKPIKDYLAQRSWVKNFKDAGRIDFAETEIPEEEDEREQEKRENEERGFYS